MMRSAHPPGRRAWPLVLWLLAVLCAGTATAAETTADGAARLVTGAVALLRDHYVAPRKVDEVEARLTAALTAGRYTGVEPGVLVERLNADLLAATADKHVYVRHDPDTVEVLSRDDRTDDTGAAYFAELARTSNHGLVEMKVLPGNVRYLEIRTFFWDDGGTAAAYDAAMSFLAGGDALIIDLRGNGGGSMQAVNYLVSHFLDPGTDLMTFDMGPDGVHESRVTRTPPAGRLDGKPSYVLVSGRTGSAAEEASMHFRHFGLATLVGATTAGAGHRNRLFPLGDGLLLSVSTGRAIHAVTGAGWDGVGVAPHRETDVEQALDVAQRAALQALIKQYPQRAAGYRQALADLDGDGP